jgi:MYXO-CTERM domain-containing protein
MRRECWATWGLQDTGDAGWERCTRGITVVVAARSAKSQYACGLGDPADAIRNVYCAPPVNLPPNTAAPFAIFTTIPAGQCYANQIGVFGFAHEVGHALGLRHGDGLDEDCDGVWDGVCDGTDSGMPIMPGDEPNDGPANLMGPSGGPLVLTDLQKDLAHQVALASVPNVVSPFGAGCVAPPLPPPPEDSAAPTPPPQGGGGCGCTIASSDPQAPYRAIGLLVAMVASLVVRRRRPSGRAS